MNDKSLSTNELLKNLQEVVQKHVPRSMSWADAEKNFEGQALTLLDSRRAWGLARFSYRVKKDALVASKIHGDFCVDIDTEAKKEAGGEVERVKSATANLKAFINMPYEEADRQKGHPKGSVLELVLNCREVRLEGARWPIVKSINIHYCSTICTSMSSIPATLHPGFLVDVEFVVSRDKEIGRKTLGLVVESALEPETNWDGTPITPDFKPKDTLGEVHAGASVEEWNCDVASLEANKAKYLKVPSEP